MDDKRQPERQQVTAAQDVAVARDFADILEERVAKCGGLTRAQARLVVARSTGVPEGKLYSLRRNRLKDIGGHILRRLGEGLINELQAELRHVEHELHIRTQIGARIDSGETLALLASREKIRAALNLPASGDGGGG
jgi:hypothetical protein